MGLLCFDPSRMAEQSPAVLSLHGPAIWVDIPVDMGGFKGFLDEVLTLLELPEAPKPGPECGFCAYRDAARNTQF